MFRRLAKLPKNNSFFLFGPRGSGKTTFLREFLVTSKTLFIDLLEDTNETRYGKNPDLLLGDIRSKRGQLDWVVIDEVQKLPKILDLVHKLIVEDDIKFALTGSSSRKLKREGANLLAGRAFVLRFFPLTYLELGETFDLQFILSWGSLPKVFSYAENEDRKSFLNSYVKTYLREEIIIEQLVRNVEGFRDFLEIAAQMNGKPLNFSSIAREAGIDSKTVKEYFQILEDTLVGFWVPGFHQSVRKAQTFQPKFYFFDVGVCRALSGALDSPPVPGTSLYGSYFEHYIITEIHRLNSYSQKDYKISSYQSGSGGEIDIILSKGMKKILVEIKSTSTIDPVEVRAYSRLAEPFGSVPKYLISQDKISSQIEDVRCLHFKDFFKEIFGFTSSF